MMMAKGHQLRRNRNTIGLACGLFVGLLFGMLIGRQLFPSTGSSGSSTGAGRPPELFIMSPCLSDAEAASLQLKHLNKHAKHKATCDDVGLCTCESDEYYFDGKECLAFEGSPWSTMFRTLRKKWHEIPVSKEEYKKGKIVHTGSLRAFSDDLVKRSDRDIAEQWQSQAPHDTFTYFYASIFKGKKILDIGSGMARQTLQFAQNGAHVTFCDVVPTNLELIRRTANYLGFGHRVQTILIEDLQTFDEDLAAHASADSSFFPLDVITAFGSMHHAPREFIQKEVNTLLKHLKVGGTWLQLAYPLKRWIDYGAPSFNVGGWGGDDGVEKTPWAEWYEPGKLMRNLAPHKFYEKWCGIINKKEFIWIELTYRGTVNATMV